MGRMVFRGESVDWTSVLGKYADLRTGPFSVVTLAERMVDLRKRYAGRTDEKLVFLLESEQVLEEGEREVGKRMRESPEGLCESAIVSDLRKYMDGS